MKIKTNVYVDGFNLYYGCLRDTPYRWLDLKKLSRMLLPGYEINRIRYFTALVADRPDNPLQRRRQLIYLRALRTIPVLSIFYGQFRTHPVRRAIVNPPKKGPSTIEVWDTKEKGSDVNLATYLLLDGFKKDDEMAVVVTNDADLAEPLRAVKRDLGLQVGIIRPYFDNIIKELQTIGSFYRPIKESALAACQFPEILEDAQGKIHKPPGW